MSTKQELENQIATLQAQINTNETSRMVEKNRWEAEKKNLEASLVHLRADINYWHKYAQEERVKSRESAQQQDAQWREKLNALSAKTLQTFDILAQDAKSALREERHISEVREASLQASASAMDHAFKYVTNKLAE